ncbi:hypothetical protein Bbelb_049490 [Branchiostoma belcheri]|nr:hypothetical protein Bbelb_049490 [Branchiostoma belcheri]
MDMAQHMDICGEVLIECRGCGNTAKRSGLEDHQYRYQLTNMQRRHSIYLGLSGPLSYVNLGCHAAEQLQDHPFMNFVNCETIEKIIYRREDTTLRPKKVGEETKASHIITNIPVRTCLLKGLRSDGQSSQENRVSEAAKLFTQSRTRVPVALMIKYPRKAQTHSERVSDFLLLGYGIHWQVEGEDVVFHDSPTQDPVSYPARPALHHYRSTSIKHEHAYLDKAWRKCLEEKEERSKNHVLLMTVMERLELDQFEAGLSTLWQTGKLSTTQKTTLDRYTAKQARTAADQQRNKKQLIDKLCLRDRSGEDQQAVQKHESTCCHRLEDCLCGMKIKRGSRDQHSSTICPSQPIPCPLGCQSQVKRGTAVLHSSQACPRLVRLCRMPGCNFQGGQEGVSAVDIEYAGLPLSEEPIMDMGRTWVREDMLNTTAASRPRARVPSGEEKVLEARAIQRLMDIGKNKGYTRLSPRVKIIFQQYRYEVSNFHRRNRVYRAISGLLTYGLRRGPPGTYYNYNEDLLDAVRDTYPSGDDVNWMLTNQDNKGGGRGGLTTEGLVEMFYRRSHQHKWKYNKNGMFRTDQQGKLVRPTGRPKLLLPVFEKREVNVGNLLDQKLPKCSTISELYAAQEHEYEVLRDDVIRNTAAPTIEQRGN